MHSISYQQSDFYQPYLEETSHRNSASLKDVKEMLKSLLKMQFVDWIFEEGKQGNYTSLNLMKTMYRNDIAYFSFDVI